MGEPYTPFKPGCQRRRKGDRVLVPATIIAFNVGGQVQVRFDPALYQGTQEAWVNSVRPDESWLTRLRRAWSQRLSNLAHAVNPKDQPHDS